MRQGWRAARRAAMGIVAAGLALPFAAIDAKAQDHMAGTWTTAPFGQNDVPPPELAELCAQSFEVHYEDGMFVSFERDPDGALSITLVGTCDYGEAEVTCTYRADGFDGPIDEVYVDRLKRIDANRIGISVLAEDGRPDPEMSWTYHRCADG